MKFARKSSGGLKKLTSRRHSKNRERVKVSDEEDDLDFALNLNARPSPVSVALTVESNSLSSGGGGAAVELMPTGEPTFSGRVTPEMEPPPELKKKRSFMDLVRHRSRSLNSKKDDWYDFSSPEASNMSTSAERPQQEQELSPRRPVQITVNPPDRAYIAGTKSVKKLAPPNYHSSSKHADEVPESPKHSPKNLLRKRPALNRYSVPDSESHFEMSDYESDYESKISRPPAVQQSTSWIPEAEERYAIASAFIFGEDDAESAIESIYSESTMESSTVFTGKSIVTTTTGLSAYSTVTETTNATDYTTEDYTTDGDDDDEETIGSKSYSTAATGETSQFDLGLDDEDDTIEDTRWKQKHRQLQTRTRKRTRPNLILEVMQDLRMLAEDLAEEQRGCCRPICAVGY